MNEFIPGVECNDKSIIGSYMIPVCDEVGDLLEFLENNREELGIKSMTFNIEQLEDIIIKTK
jgi:hypothetical protein